MVRHLLPLLFLAACSTPGNPAAADLLIDKYPYCAGHVTEQSRSYAVCVLGPITERHVFVGEDALARAQAEVDARNGKPDTWWVDGFDQVDGVDVAWVATGEPWLR